MRCSSYKLGSDPTITLIVYDPLTGQPLDISSATIKKMRFKTGADAVLERSATFATDGTDGKLSYQVVTDEFAVGRWRVEGLVTIGGNDHHTTSAMFEVEAALT